MKVHSKSRTRKILAATWIIPIICASPYLFYKSYPFVIFSDMGSISRQICTDRFNEIDVWLYGEEADQSGRFRKGFFFFLFIVIYLVPLIVILGTCVRIAMRLLKPIVEKQESVQGQRITRKREENKRRVARMIIVVAAAFIAAWSPFYLVTFISQVQTQSFLRQSNYIFVMLAVHLVGFINSCINPLIYNVMSEKFRNSFGQIALSVCCLCARIPTGRFAARTRRALRPAHSCIGGGASSGGRGGSGGSARFRYEAGSVLISSEGSELTTVRLTMLNRDKAPGNPPPLSATAGPSVPVSSSAAAMMMTAAAAGTLDVANGLPLLPSVSAPPPASASAAAAAAAAHVTMSPSSSSSSSSSSLLGSAGGAECRNKVVVVIGRSSGNSGGGANGGGKDRSHWMIPGGGGGGSVGGGGGSSSRSERDELVGGDYGGKKDHVTAARKATAAVVLGSQRHRPERDNYYQPQEGLELHAQPTCSLLGHTADTQQ